MDSKEPKHPFSPSLLFVCCEVENKKEIAAERQSSDLTQYEKLLCLSFCASPPIPKSKTSDERQKSWEKETNNKTRGKSCQGFGKSKGEGKVRGFSTNHFPLEVL